MLSGNIGMSMRFGIGRKIVVQSISEDVPLALCYDPRQVITLAGKRYLSGAVIFVRYDTDGYFVPLPPVTCI